MSATYTHEELGSMLDSYRPAGTDAERQEFARDFAAAIRRHIEAEGRDATPDDGSATGDVEDLEQLAMQLGEADPSDTRFDNLVENLRSSLRAHADAFPDGS
ncbi:MAG: hypothetical protein KY469_05510 [Actinobacteria bacterium]|nr:hypothetical protein [Actinomycetota bacterium]